MPSASVAPSDVPLRRLLKRQEADELLSEFAALLPGRDLAMVSASGRIFAGSGEWKQPDLQTLLAQVVDGAMIETADLLLQPLLANDRLLGALVARNRPRSQEQTVTQILRCLHSSLTLLLDQAKTQRDVVRETLDRYREINLLYRVGETIGSCLNPEEIPQLVLEQVRTVVQADAGSVLLPSLPTAASPEEWQARDSFGTDTVLQTLHTISRQITEQVARAAQPSIVTPTQFPLVEGATESIGAILCAPLKAQDKVLGILLLGRLAGQAEFTAGDEKLVMAVTGQAAIALETARLHHEEVAQQRLEEELAIAHQIQLSFLPESCPIIPGWEFAAQYRSARQVGGDLYDFISLPDAPHLLSLVIADVTGKGVPAALFMAFSRMILRSESATGCSPASALRQANRYILKDSRSRLFLSAFYATLDTRNGRLIYANGGHDWPLWLRAATGRVQPLAAPGFILGAFQDIKPEEQEIEIAPGDLLILYTDGVTEARDSSGRLFGEEQLQETIAACVDADAQQLLHTVVGAVEAFTGTTPQADDFTLLVVKRKK